MFKKTVFLLSIFIIILFLFSGCNFNSATNTQNNNKDGNSILVYSGAGLKKPVEEIGTVFEKQTGIKVNYIFGGSAYLNSQIMLTGQGDVYLPGDMSELEPLKEKNLISWIKNIVYHIPVLAVSKGNPAEIKSLQDLEKPGIKVALGDPDANPIGKLSNKVLSDLNLLDGVNKNVVVRTPTANELILYLSTKQADASIIWEENYKGSEDKIELIESKELSKYTKIVPVTVLKYSKQKELAQKLAEFYVSDTAQQIWTKFGYKIVK